MPKAKEIWHCVNFLGDGTVNRDQYSPSYDRIYLRGGQKYMTFIVPKGMLVYKIDT
jgi:hypothetical protein